MEEEEEEEEEEEDDDDFLVLGFVSLSLFSPTTNLALSQLFSSLSNLSPSNVRSDFTVWRRERMAVKEARIWERTESSGSRGGGGRAEAAAAAAAEEEEEEEEEEER